MKQNKAALLLLAFVLLPACASKPVGKEPAELRSFKEGASVEIRWKRNVGQVLGAGLQPAVAGDAVYVANVEGELFRLDSINGKKIWKIDCGFKISGAVGAGEGLVIVGGLKGELAAFDENGVSVRNSADFRGIVGICARGNFDVDRLGRFAHCLADPLKVVDQKRVVQLRLRYRLSMA